MSFRAAVLVCAIPFLFIGCRTKTAGSRPPRYAVLRFENLSGDPGLDWFGRAVSEALPVSLAQALDGPVLGSSALSHFSATLGSRPPSTPGISAERAEAIAAGAARLISGYVERADGDIRISATEEDAATGKSLRIVTASGFSPLAALADLEHRFSPNARPALTSNPEALRDYAVAFESPAQERAGLLEKATHLDPAFGEAWVALVEVDMAAGNRAGAESVVEQARGQKLDALSRANLDLAQANLKQDRQGIIAAMQKVADLSPADLALRRTLAGAETAAGQFDAAALEWQKITAVQPGDALAWNSLGYARSYAGDYAAAMGAFREYQQLRPKDANPLDSIGDLNYSFGKYKEAAESYLEASKKQPDFEQFGDLYKAAWAKYRAGDAAGGDALFSQFRKQREKASNAAVELLAADWLYRTGRTKEAMATLRKLGSESASPNVRADARAQAVIWDLLEGNRAQAARDAVAIGPKITAAPVFMARFAALPSASPETWQARAQKIPGNGLRQFALGYALLLDGKPKAAIPVWAQIVKSTSATDAFSHAIYARIEGRPLKRPLVPDPNNLNQFLALLEKL